MCISKSNVEQQKTDASIELDTEEGENLGRKAGECEHVVATVITIIPENSENLHYCKLEKILSNVNSINEQKMEYFYHER